MSRTRIDATRLIAAPATAIFDLISRPAGHVSIDSSGMLQSASGSPVQAVGDEFVVHMDREALGDRPMGKYDVTVTITKFAADRQLEWNVGTAEHPSIGHVYGYELQPDAAGTLVTSYCDWSALPDSPQVQAAFPVVPETALRATLGILARTVEPAA